MLESWPLPPHLPSPPFFIRHQHPQCAIVCHLVPFMCSHRLPGSLLPTHPLVITQEAIMLQSWPLPPHLPFPSPLFVTIIHCVQLGAEA